MTEEGAVPRKISQIWLIYLVIYCRQSEKPKKKETKPKLVYIEYSYDYKGRVNFTWHGYDIQKLKSINMILCHTLTKL